MSAAPAAEGGARLGRIGRSPAVWLGIALSALCLWLAFRKVPFGPLGESLAGADYVWLAPAIGMHLAAILVRGARWQTLLAERGILADAFWAQNIGFLFTNALPLRMGEPARILALAGKARLPLMRVAASAVVERMLDVGTVLGILALSLPWMQVPAVVLQAGGVFAGVVAAGAVIVLILIRSGAASDAWLRRTLARLHLPVDGLMRRWHEGVAGLRPLMRADVGLASLGWSALVWLLYVGYYWCVLRAFRTDPAPVEAAFMVVALALAISIPSSPGFIGVYQLAGQQALVLPFGERYDASMALAVTLVTHVVYFVITSVLGAIGLARTGVRFADIGSRVLSGRGVIGAAPAHATATGADGPDPDRTGDRGGAG